jgi:lauroyl/myristoyl acyltransferase
VKIVSAVLKRHWLALVSLALIIVLLALAEPAHLVFAAAVVVVVGLWLGDLSVELAGTRRRLARANLLNAQQRAATEAAQEKAETMLDAVFKAYLDMLSTNQSAYIRTRLSDLHQTCQAICYGDGSEFSTSVTQGAGGGLIGVQQ